MEIDVLLDRRLAGCPDETWLRTITKKALIAAGAGPDVELSLVITGQKQIQELNKQYRSKDKPTDVLSFSMTPQSADESFITPADGLTHLGEVVISCPQAKLQAKECGHSLKEEMAALIIHGVLHVLGYDHMKTADRNKMRSKEQEVFAALTGLLRVEI